MCRQSPIGFVSFMLAISGWGKSIFPQAANERLSNYLWFGNLNEMETVIARTLALQRKSRIEAADLIFDFDACRRVAESCTSLRSSFRSEAREKSEFEAAKVRHRPVTACTRRLTQRIDMSNGRI